jgi:hypothetical protein
MCAHAQNISVAFYFIIGTQAADPYSISCYGPHLQPERLWGGFLPFILLIKKNYIINETEFSSNPEYAIADRYSSKFFIMP